jgi:hypothetical protein
MAKTIKFWHRGIRRGYVPKEMWLKPGDQNVVNQEVFQTLAKKDPMLKSHMSSKPRGGGPTPVSFVQDMGGGKVRVKLEPISETGDMRTDTLYRAHKYHFGAEDEVTVTGEQWDELMTDPHFAALVGQEIQPFSIEEA